MCFVDFIIQYLFPFLTIKISLLSSKTFSFKLLSQLVLFSAMWLFLFYCPSSATFSTQPMKPLVCMLQPCRLRTLLLQQILYRSAAFHFNSLLRCSTLLQHVLVTSLKLLGGQDALKFLQPIENVLLQKVEHQISGLHHFPCQYSSKLADDGSCQTLLCQWCAGGQWWNHTFSWMHNNLIHEFAS